MLRRREPYEHAADIGVTHRPIGLIFEAIYSLNAAYFISSTFLKTMTVYLVTKLESSNHVCFLTFLG